MSIEASISFDGFKIDTIELSCKPQLNVLLATSMLDGSWDVRIAIRHPIFMRGAKKYICGLNAMITAFEKPLTEEPNQSAENALVTLKMGIAGAFSSTEKMDPAVEERFVKAQMPAILLPYLRAAITSVLASSGIGVARLPLINVQKLAEDTLKDVPVQIQD